VFSGLLAAQPALAADLASGFVFSLVCARLQMYAGASICTAGQAAEAPAAWRIDNRKDYV
jgi:hypothetical protein